MFRKTIICAIMAIAAGVGMSGNNASVERGKSSKKTPAQRDTVIIRERYRYEGQWPEGKGVLCSYRHGLVFGTFKEGGPEGLCINYGPGGQTYWGPIVDGHRTGKACMSRKGGVILVRGDFVNGRQHGIDTVYRENGTVIIGRYQEGKFVEAIQEFNDRIPKDIRKARPKFPKITLTNEQRQFLVEYNEWYREQSQKARKKQKTESGEVKPSFNGRGPNAFAEWVNARLKYPAEASKHNIEGATILQFTITTSGELTNIRIIRSSGNTSLDMEALRVVSDSPLWEPGTQNGRPTDMKLTFPVIFKSNR